MTGFFKKLIGKDPMAKTYKEFESLVTLEAKRKKYIDEYGTNEDLELQKEILDNNIITLAHVFTSLNPEIMNKKKTEYFNMQGTPVNVVTLQDPKSSYSHTKTETKTSIIHLEDMADLIEEIVSLERKFQSLKQGRLKQTAFFKIQGKALSKIKAKVIDYCNTFKGNEDLVRQFVFRNMVEPDEDYHNDLLMYERLNFLGFLVGTIGISINDSTSIEIANKEIVQIPLRDYHTTMNIELFLKEFKTHKYDFILKLRGSGSGETSS